MPIFELKCEPYRKLRFIQFYILYTESMNNTTKYYKMQLLQLKKLFFSRNV